MFIDIEFYVTQTRKNLEMYLTDFCNFKYVVKQLKIKDTFLYVLSCTLMGWNDSSKK